MEGGNVGWVTERGNMGRVMEGCRGNCEVGKGEGDCGMGHRGMEEVDKKQMSRWQRWIINRFLDVRGK